MDEDSKEKAEKMSKNLAKLGKELSEIQFNYKVLEKSNAEYWQKRTEAFKKYHAKGMEYYAQIHLLMSLIAKEEAGFFLLNMSKLRQLGIKMTEVLEQVAQSPSTVSSKDKQQSKWSKEIRIQLIEYSNETLNQEKIMNKKFREFYEKYLKTTVGS